MLTEEIFALGLGLQSPWKFRGQRFDMEKHPHELDLIIGADSGAPVLRRCLWKLYRLSIPHKSTEFIGGNYYQGEIANARFIFNMLKFNTFQERLVQ